MCGGAKVEPKATHCPMLPRQFLGIIKFLHLSRTASLLQAHGALERPEWVQYGSI